ncbi:MAG: SGNH/GDSL hydrolase family protein [Acidimicrobiales bacterium]|nr:SGNH/GDSL hydrolase family protein [Acidimicrobiales bacterium]
MTSGSHRWFARLAPVGGLVVAAVLVVRGHLWLALAMAALVFALLQARLVSPRFRGWFEATATRAAHLVAHVVGTGLSWFLLSVVFVAIVVPVWVLTVPFHRRRFGRPRGVKGDGWITRGSAVSSPPSHRTFGPERGFGGSAGTPTEARAPATDEPARDNPPSAPVRPPRWSGRRHRVLVGFGVVLALLVADLALGAVLSATGVREGPRGDTRRQVEQAVSATMAAPPLADEPWVEEYRQALIDYQLGGGTYTPFLVRGPRAFTSESLNTTEDERLSYTPAAGEGEPLRVAFFGGSVMFGVGQRDEHTIPSEVARLAEEEGIALEVDNYGLPGWVSWQEVQYLERLLARGDQYDLIVFYDGFNELLVQGTGYSPDPTHLGADVMDRFASDYHAEHEEDPGLWDGASELATAYRRNSGIALLLGEAVPDPTASQGGLRRATATPEEQADAAIDIYGRAIALANALGDAHDTPVRFFWQPAKAGWPDELIDRLPDGVIDVSHALDGREDEVYIDEVHTDEVGARIMAEALWAEIGPELEALSDDAER